MIGSVVGNYKIIDKIGEGGMGSVFKGVDLMLEREVAVKMLRPELARQPNVVERFRTEAVTLAKLNHPNVATLHSFFRQGDDFFMVMEFVRGETLERLIRRSGSMSCDKAVELFCQALEGIDHAHKMGIVHRDIKPANMMLTESGSIKVMDFGIARVLGTDRLTKTGHLIGTVEYMSPEQVRGEETDARSDIYSMGILLYEMLTGRVPFNSASEYELMRSHIEEAPPPPRSFAPQIPPTVEQAIMRALAKLREARQQTASEFRSMLLQANLGAVTRVDVPVGSPASYVTQLGEPLTAAPGKPIVKETRLADDRGLAPTAYADSIRETRLASNGDQQDAYQQQPSQASFGSLLSKLNWKHYTAAAAALVALISLPFVFAGGGGKSQTTQQPAVTQPPQQPQTSGTAAAPVQQPAPEASAPAPFAIELPTNGAGAAQGSKPARSRDAGGGNRVRASDSSGAPQGDSRAVKQKSGGGERATDRRSENSQKDVKKSKIEKAAEAAGAVGGAIKSVGGFFKKKKQ